MMIKVGNTIVVIPPPTPAQDPIPYTFQYGVRDDYSGANFGQNEESDGSQTSGSYQVVLPDGRIQTVSCNRL